MASAESNLEALRKSYCPPIDDAVFYAISSDYDVPHQLDELTKVLDSLKANAFAEENTPFDPSGTGGGISQPEDYTNVSRTTPEEHSVSNDPTSITSDFHDVQLNDSTNIGKDLGHLSVEEKVQWLQGLFPSLPAQQVRDALDTTSSPDQAIEELLTFSFLADDSDAIDDQELPKGIDSFAEEVLGPRRKGRSKRKGKTTDSSRASSAGSYASNLPVVTNAWSTAADEVDFICSKTALQPKTVRSFYHASGANLALTLRRLAEKEGANLKTLPKTHEILEQQIAEIKPDFATVPDEQIYGLLVLARNIPSAAYELLEAMTAPRDIASVSTGKLHVLAQYAPLNLEPSDQPVTAEESWTTLNTGDSTKLAAAHNIAVDQAFTQASTAYRKSKSNHLYGGAAAYYSQVGHERLKVAKELSAARANTHVDAQSMTNVLDLHGVDVQNAVRIARFKVQQWWDNLGDAKYASGGGGPARSGYRLVTGVGTHSKNHAPRIGPAVSRMLVNEGWKVTVLHGEIVVNGRQRRQ